VVMRSGLAAAELVGVFVSSSVERVEKTARTAIRRQFRAGRVSRRVGGNLGKPRT
jgi:hypothetical protein